MNIPVASGDASAEPRCPSIGVCFEVGFLEAGRIEVDRDKKLSRA